MRLAVFSDVHSNLEALHAVLGSCRDTGADRLLCLGDLVGYGADPNACVELVRQSACLVLAGNHDHAAAGLEAPRYFNPMALSAILWTSNTLLDCHARYLAALPLSESEGDAFYTHSSPQNPEAWPYIHIPEEGRAALAFTNARICFVGHSHHPFLCSDAGAEVIGEGKADLVPTERYLINTGSVGQPRDGDPRAAFALWDQEAGRLELHRVPYDLETAQHKIRSAGLPELLAERLELGR